VVGKLVHAALAAWRFPDAQFDGWAEALARDTGLLDARQLADAVRESRRLLTRFQGHPLYRRIAQAEQRRHEVPYSLLADGRPESGVIDLLFLEKGRWIIVEFKTDVIRDEAGLETTLAEADYVAQVRRYILAVERLLGQLPEGLLCWLNYRPGVAITPVMAAPDKGPAAAPVHRD
jgi:ATP-dependent exoDNAse (exonuclease V) beta subunit